MLNFLLGMSAVLSATAYPVSEWLAPADHHALEATEAGWSGSIFRHVYIGRGETRESWSRRITTWSAPRDIWGPGPMATQADTARQTVLDDCPGARSGTLRLFTWSGRPAGEFWIACDLLPATGRPDHYFVRMISGKAHLLAAAITFRAPPTNAEVAAASAYLDTLMICTEANAGSPAGASRCLPARYRRAAAQPNRYFLVSGFSRRHMTLSRK